MAAGPKAAGFAAFMRVFLFGFPIVTAAASTAGYAHATWVGALAIMAALTMSIGNVVAIVQNNVKRMLAYSSIAHAGYALVGFVAAGAATDAAQRGAAVTAVAFYLLTYAVMNMGAFAIITVIARKGDQRNNVDDYNGIGFSSPVLAFSLSVFLLSLLGMPLTAGFMGKIMVFSAAVNQGYVWLVVIGVLEHRGFGLLLPASDCGDVLPRAQRRVGSAAYSSRRGGRVDTNDPGCLLSRTISRSRD
jgi:NADH-quinone oxidoreductase subunit N